MGLMAGRQERGVICNQKIRHSSSTGRYGFSSLVSRWFKHFTSDRNWIKARNNLQTRNHSLATLAKVTTKSQSYGVLMGIRNPRRVRRDHSYSCICSFMGKCMPSSRLVKKEVTIFPMSFAHNFMKTFHMSVDWEASVHSQAGCFGGQTSGILRLGLTHCGIKYLDSMWITFYEPK